VRKEVVAGADPEVVGCRDVCSPAHRVVGGEDSVSTQDEIRVRLEPRRTLEHAHLLLRS
jgi:hypothetical protein